MPAAKINLDLYKEEIIQLYLDSPSAEAFLLIC